MQHNWGPMCVAIHSYRNRSVLFQGTRSTSTGALRHPPSSADYYEPFLNTYCRDDDLAVLIRGANNARARRATIPHVRSPEPT